MEKLVDIGIMRGYAERVLSTRPGRRVAFQTMAGAVTTTGLPKISEPILSRAEVCP